MKIGWDPTGKLDVLEILSTLDINNVRREGRNEVRFSCPFPNHANGDNSGSAYMNAETGKWHCFGCKREGEAYTFVASMMNISPLKAKMMLRQAYDPSSLDPDSRNMRRELENRIRRSNRKLLTPTNHPIDPSVVDEFAVDWDAVQEAIDDDDRIPTGFDYMLNRGFAAKTLNYWNVGFDFIKSRIVFPVYDEMSNLIGFKGRKVLDVNKRVPKYIVLGDKEDDDDDKYGFPRYHVGSVVFGLNKLIESGVRDLIVVEGELNVMALWQMGHRNAVALNGSRLTEAQYKLLRKHADSLTFFFDSDNAGDTGMWGREDDKGYWHPGALEQLAQMARVDIVAQSDDDAAGYLKDGESQKCDDLIAAAIPYTLARLKREFVAT